MNSQPLRSRDRLSLVQNWAQKIQAVTYMSALTLMIAMFANHPLAHAVAGAFSTLIHAILN